MWFSSWLRNRTDSAKRRPANCFRPHLELLEDRAVPATFTVNTTLDVLGHANGLLSLRQAILDANATPKTADTIVLPAGNYTLTRAGAGEDNCLTGDLDVKGPLTINGAEANSTVVDAAGLDRVFHTYNYAVTLSGMTIRGGNAGLGGLGSQGGGIFNPYTTGLLTVNNCVISANSAAIYGGGIYSGGSLTVNNSAISANLVNAGGWGGGIYNIGTLTVSNSAISGNSAPGTTGGAGGLGGGIAHVSGMMTVQSSTLSGNSARVGGAISFSSTRYYPSVVQTCTISNNTAMQGGGIYNTGGILTVQNSELSGNSAVQGGALYNRNATLNVTDCTLIGNSASQGGGIYNSYGPVKVLNSTISGNSATDSGGGIFNANTAYYLTVTGSTVTGNSATNSGGGIFNGLSATLTVSGSTVLDNSAPLGGDLYNLGRVFLIDSTIGDIYP